MTQTVRDSDYVERDDREGTGGLALDGTPQAPTGDRRVRLPVFGEKARTTRQPKAGMGVVFDAGHPEDKDEPGGPIFSVEERGSGWVLRFGRTDLERVSPGDKVWLTQDPEVQRGVQKLLDEEPRMGNLAIDIAFEGAAGRPLVAHAVLRRGEKGERRVRLEAISPLQEARGRGLDEALLRDKVGALGGTPFFLRDVSTEELVGALHAPVSELKELRRALTSRLEALITERRALSAGPHTSRLRASIDVADLPPEAPRLVPLCRTSEQLEAVIEAKLPEVELDWMEMVGLSKAVGRAREAGLEIHLATLRIEKPGEEALTDRLLALSPQAIVVRHWGGFERLRGRSDAPRLLGDFSLNVTNSLTARFLLARGLERFTPSFDLDEAQLFAMLGEVPRGRASIVVHHRIPTFHTEHCVYAHLLSTGRDYHSCGRPCEAHEISLRDRVGKSHPVIVDAGCRNTVFNSAPQSAAMLVPKLLASGVSRFRMDLVRETREETASLIAAYGSLLAGTATPTDVLRVVAADDRVGVTAAMSLFRREESAYPSV